MDRAKVERLVRELLVEIGEDPEREGLQRTPHRIALAYEFLTSGYQQTAEELTNGAMFGQAIDGMVIARDIEFYSLCEHHLLPFYGRCHIGYVANGKVYGVSKLARLVDMYARRLQLQERLTEQVAAEVMQGAGALGVGVVMEGHHLCMMMRGVQKQNSVMTTSSMLGSFRKSASTRAEFLNLIGRPSI